MSVSAALAEIGEIRREFDAAVDTLLAHAEAGLAAARHGAPADLDQIRSAFHAILEASGFHDLSSQRLGRLEALLAPQEDGRPDGHLLNGPMALDCAPTQASIDALFDDAEPTAG